MATPRYPTTQYLAGDFVTSAGCVLFRRIQVAPPSPSLPLESGSESTTDSHYQICILHNLTRDEWLLPKGRKDQGESIEKAAVRETFEETGYQCRLWPQTLLTRAPAPGLTPAQGDFSAKLVEGCTEPIAVTIRDLGKGDAKIIYWFTGITDPEEGAVKVEGTQMETENYESVFLPPREALERLTFVTDREVLGKAMEIVLKRSGSESVKGV